MKKQLFTAIAVCLSLCGYAQTRGTNALGFGINSFTDKSTNSGSENKLKSNSFSLGYGHFIKDNAKIGFDLNYGFNKRGYQGNTEAEAKNYGASVSYQKYFPIVKTLYAYAGGKLGYSYISNRSINQNFQENIDNSHRYAAGAYGGVTWFVSKRFALETSLLSADIAYSETKRENNQWTNDQFKNTSTSFNMSTQGFINDLSFKIYLLF